MESYLDPIQFDGTPKSHPAWFRGKDVGVREMLSIIDAIISGADVGSGKCNSQPIEDVRRTLIQWREVVNTPPPVVEPVAAPVAVPITKLSDIIGVKDEENKKKK